VSLYYRVRIGKLHTWEQIAVGLLVGTFNGALWHHLCVRDTGGNVLSFVTTHLLDEHGVLPWPMLAVPAILGLAVVGSFERRIGRWIKTAKSE